MAIASAEKAFTSMSYMKNKLTNRVEERYLNDCLVTFIERDFFLEVKDNDIISRFLRMTKRKVKM
jgi:hypothetical protein